MVFGLDPAIANPPFLPLELWLETFVHLYVAPQWKLFTTIEDIRPDLRSFRSLVLVSREFKLLAEPLLYEWFSLRNEYVESPGQRLAPKLKIYPEKVAFIKYMSIEGMYGARHEFNQEITDLLTPDFCQRLTNLKALRLHSTHITTHTVSTLIQLPSLQIWESHFLQFTDDPMALRFDPSTLNLTHLLLRTALYNSKGEEPCSYGEEELVQMALSPPLQVLDMTCSTITPDSMIQRIKNPPPNAFKSLHKLKVELPFDLTVFHDFARHCPNVTYAELEDFLPEDAPRPPLPQGLLPKMRVFHSTPGLVPVFVPGRPVDTLKFT